jgi:hypothetical protein
MLNRKFPSYVIFKHPSGAIKQVSKPLVFLLSFFLGPIYFFYVGLNSFAKKYFTSVFVFCVVLALFIQIENKFLSLILFILLILEPFYYLYLALTCYDARCNILYEMGFRQIDASGNPIER